MDYYRVARDSEQRGSGQACTKANGAHWRFSTFRGVASRSPPAVRLAQFLRNGCIDLIDLLDACGLYICFRPNGAIECGLLAVRLEAYGMTQEVGLRLRSFFAAGSTEAAPDVLFRRPLPLRRPDSDTVILAAGVGRRGSLRRTWAGLSVCGSMTTSPFISNHLVFTV